MTKLIYIIGTSFSGSTFLDNLLGCNSEIISLGETINLNDYVINSKKCMCGEKIEICQMWTDIINCDKKDKKYFNEDYLHYNYYKDLAKNKDYLSEKNKNYANFLFSNYRKISESNKKSILVDSSKNLNHLHLLISNCPDDFNICILHLVRHPAAYINSAKNHYPDTSFLYRLIEWYNSYKNFNNLLKNNKNLSITIFYKDLCNDSLNTLNLVFKIFNINKVEELPKLSNLGKHIIEGNPTKINFNKIYYSEKWKKELALIGKLMSIPFLVLFKYFYYKNK